MAGSRRAVATLADAVKRLNKLTGLSVSELQRLVSAQPSRPRQMITIPLYNKERRFSAELVSALDGVFAERIAEYPAGALTRAFRTEDLRELRQFLGDDLVAGAGEEGPTEASAPDLAEPPGLLARRPVVKLGVLAGVLVVVFAVGGWGWYHTRPVAVNGVVSCTSGAQVTGVWVSWFEPLNWGDFSEPPTQGSASGEWEFTAHTPLLTSWRARVGCGGTSQVWAVKAFSGSFSDNPVRLVCDDQRRDASGVRECTVVR